MAYHFPSAQCISLSSLTFQVQDDRPDSQYLSNSVPYFPRNYVVFVYYLVQSIEDVVGNNSRVAVLSMISLVW